jgi:hypothetical protein
MASWWSRWRRNRRVSKARPGDGSALVPVRWWQVLSRSVFRVPLAGPDGVEREYAVAVSYFDPDEKVALYRDGRQHLVGTQPVSFPVPGGVIDVALGTYGVTRAHFVPDDGGPERVLEPVPHSAEYWRSVLDRRHPTLSRWLGRAAVVVLLVGLVLLVPQLLELVTRIDAVAERVGVFTSPVSLPPWLNTTLTVAGVLASLERALTLRNHWLLDVDTLWIP